MGSRSRHVLVGSLALVVGSGCATPYPALTCDPDAAGEMVFGYQRGGVNFVYEAGEEVNGTDFLFIDGACRYWAGGYTRVATGTLDDDQLAAINEELLTADWPIIDGEHSDDCLDGAMTGLARDAIRATRCDGPPLSETYTPLARTAARWSDQLAVRGERVAPDAPLRVNIVRRNPWGYAMPWPLDTPLAELAGGTVDSVTVHVLEGADAATLRGLTPSALTDGTIYVTLRLVDIVVPFADDDGCLRALIPGGCRPYF